MWKAGLLISLFLLGRADCFVPPDASGPSTCWRPLVNGSSCVPSNSSTCFGSPFPYAFIPSSAELGLLESWAYLKRIPKCWSSLKPLLCALNAPQCSNTQEASLRVPKALCRALRGPCRGLRPKYLPLSLQARWDATFNCSGDSYCEREIGSQDILKFHESQEEGLCVKPLLPTQHAANYFKSIDGCGLQCFPPDKTPEQYGKIKSLIGFGVLGSLLTSLFATATLCLDWRGSSSYPNRIIFYMNLCSLLFISGWGLQFLQGEDSIVCNPDGTRRVLEPGEGQDLSCVVVFVLVYYFGLASALWYTVLAFSWDALFSSMGHLSAMSQRDLLLKRTPYFHMISWSIPAILSIAIISLNGVEGDPLTGICFVSKRSPPFYYGFVIAPLGIIALVSSFFVCKCIKSLIFAEKSAIEISGVSGRSRRIRATTIKILLYASLYLACFLIAMSSAHWIGYEEKRDEAILNMYLGGQEFHKPPKYSEIVILPVFISVIASASWVWNKNTFKSWRKFFRRRFNASEERMKDIKVRKHELITQAFAKRKDLAAEGRLSLTFESSRFDPVGVGSPSKFDELDGPSSGNFSSTWAAALPRLVQRRGALVGGELINQMRRSSLDSEASSMNRFSWMMTDSRRGSFESQASSIPAFDLDRLQAIYDQAISSSARKRPKKRSKKRKLIFSSSSRPESRLSSRRNSLGSASFVTSRQNESVITLDPRKLMETQSSRRFLSSPKEFFELKEKLKVLQASSIDLSESKNNNNMTRTTTLLGSGEELHKRSVSVQTSFTDLRGLQRVVGISELGTQTTPPPGASDSSSQTPGHIEPVVIQISDGVESSSFPSSSEGGGRGAFEVFLKGDQEENELTTHRGPPMHNRGRRGAIIETSSFKHLKEDLELCRLSAGVLTRPLQGSPLIDTSSTS